MLYSTPDSRLASSPIPGGWEITDGAYLQTRTFLVVVVRLVSDFCRRNVSCAGAFVELWRQCCWSLVEQIWGHQKEHWGKVTCPVQNHIVTLPAFLEKFPLAATLVVGELSLLKVPE
jgi:hypothetical protein